MTKAEQIEHAKAKSDSLANDLLLAFPSKIKVSLRGNEFLLETPSALEVLTVRLGYKAKAKANGVLLDGDTELEKLSKGKKAANTKKSKALIWDMVIDLIRLCGKGQFDAYTNNHMKVVCEQSGGLFNSPLTQAAAVLTGQDSNAFTMQILSEEDDPFGSPKTTDGE